MARRQVGLAMGHEPQASRPDLRLEDAQLLAGADRAVRHRDGHPVPIWVILEHLQLPTPPNRREVHARLRVLEQMGLLQGSRFLPRIIPFLGLDAQHDFLLRLSAWPVRFFSVAGEVTTGVK